MKSRIVTELACLASGKESDYLPILRKEFQKDEDAIRQQAQRILTTILHDYSAFAISTIDKFFQQTMRAFAREIRLGGGYNVELDQDKVLNEAIDTMFSDLEKPENKELLDWLIHFAEENIEDGNAWEIRKNIHSLAREIFKENYKALIEKEGNHSADKEQLERYKKQLKDIITAYEREAKRLASEALQILDEHHLTPEDFPFKKSSGVGTLQKWMRNDFAVPTKRFLNLIDNEEAWYGKSTPKDTTEKLQAIFPTFNKAIKEAVVHFEGNRKAYLSAVEASRYFFTLGILVDINRKVENYCAENNIMLISNTTELLSKIIGHTDTPFVYEKIGSRIRHYMIDEFQDTSTLQWANFKPLISNSLAGNNVNLIVGDVKQSIYRWRNSDWKLLNEQLEKDFTGRVLNDSLDTNWRSTKNVILFNNSIFRIGSKIVQDSYNQDLSENISEDVQKAFSSKIIDAYAHLEQHIPSKKQDKLGRVRAEFIPTDTPWKEEVLLRLPTLIEDLQARGYTLQDIAILVRSKAEGLAVAECLLAYKKLHPQSQYRFDIISNEALFVANSEQVKTVIAILRHFLQPLDKTLRAIAVYELRRQQKGNFSHSTALLNTESDFSDEELSSLNAIANLPLYEMIEGIFALIHTPQTNEDVYIQAFMDMALEFSNNYSADNEAFIRWWDESGCKKTVFTPDTQDAIRIMTVHKSKGLGFNVVILPFCQWSLDGDVRNILWCRPEVEPFSNLSPIPLKYSSKLGETIFATDYYNEKVHSYIDNLNVLYVAFTRAKNELYTFSPRPSKEKVTDTNDVASLLWTCLHQNPEGENLMALAEHFNEDDGLFEMGSDYLPTPSVKTTNETEIVATKTVSIPFDNRLKIRLVNKYFFAKDGQRELGILMHDILSNIHHRSEVPEVLKKHIAEGYITNDEAKQMENDLYAFFSIPQVSNWYSGQYKIKNEVEILLPDGKFVRPDRVMLHEDSAIVIDYKFGDVEAPKYKQQVQRYMRHITQMGYPNVEGYVCYIKQGKIVKV